MKKNSNKFLYVFLVIFVFFCGCGAMYGIVNYLPITVNQKVTKVEKDVTVTDEGIADAVEKVYDAVVVVMTYKDDTEVASGTGFVYQKKDNKYYFLTNYHVIEGGNKVKVKLTDKEILDTTIVGFNEYADIAVLSVETKKDLTVAKTGSSTDARIGDTTFAVGAPLDDVYSWTVTRGIISGKDRKIEVEDYVINVLQTDASINSGNSGGPLCNANGEVIGINSLKLVSSGVEGMGFAIPIEEAIDQADSIISGNAKVNPYIGVSMVNIDDVLTDLRYRNYYMTFIENIQKAKISDGVGITEVEKDSPAAKGGLKAGDIIYAINNEEVSNVAYLRYNLYKFKIGDTIKIKVYRNGESKEVKVTLAKNEETN